MYLAPDDHRADGEGRYQKRRRGWVFEGVRCLRLAMVGVLAGAVLAGAQEIDEHAPVPLPRMAWDGPPAPVWPEVITRDDTGRATVRATRLAQPLEIDGRLDEEIYRTVPGAAGFIQSLPDEGAPALELTDIWVFFDDRNLYVSARCWDSHAERMVANELTRDSGNAINGNEGFSVGIDTFLDRRNGYSFQTNAIGALREQAIGDHNANDAWNTVWDVRVSRDDKGWSAEFVIPFKSLRYPSAGPQVWGFQARRYVRWSNEMSHLTRVARQYATNGVNQMNLAGTLVGVETPATSPLREVKPYAMSTVLTDKTAATPISNDLTSNFGLDFKYGVTRGLIADVTVNTDFAQVEEDSQQVNLTRFNLFFNERRDFFLENIGIFGFANLTSALRGQTETDAEAPILFFSRQIGLSGGQAVPVRAGGRLSGRAGPYSLGVLNIQTDDKPSAGAVSTNFTVATLKRNILRRSIVGAMVTRRSPAASRDDDNLSAGVDGVFRFYRNVNFITYYAQTRTSGLTGNDRSYRGKFEYNGDRYATTLEHMMVGDAFNPEIGFVRRVDFRRSYAMSRFSPRPQHSRLVRQYTYQASVDYITNPGATLLQNRDAKGLFGIAFHNSDAITVNYASSHEYLPRDFAIATGVVVPAGGYDYQAISATYSMGTQRPVSGSFVAGRQGLYEGTRTTASYSGRVAFNAHVAIEPRIEFNWVALPYGDFTTALIANRLVLNLTPRMALINLIQYNRAARSLTSSARLRWEYSPNSHFFVVYTDGRDTLTSGVPDLLNRSLAIKVTRLVRF